MPGYKRTYKRKPYAKKGSDKRVAKIAKQVYMRETETKEKTFPYTSVGGNAVTLNSISYGSSAATCALAAGIALGTQGDQRIGRSVYLRGIYIYLAVQPGDNTNYLRFMVVRNKGQFDGTSTANTISQVLSGAGSGSTQWCNPIDTDTWDCYWDKSYTMRYLPLDGNTGTTVPQLRVIKKFIKINRKIEYSSNTSISPIQDLWLMAISDSAAVPHPGAVAGFVKLYYKDN